MTFYEVVEFSKEEKIERTIAGDDPADMQIEIAYFRKFHDFNSFLGTLYPDDIGDFNCEPLWITPEILEEIKDWGSGHFHVDIKDGGSDWEHYGTAWNAMEEGIQASFDEGNKVFYMPWW